MEQSHSQQACKDKLYAKILDVLPFTIFLEDAEGRPIFINRYASARFGVTLAQMEGRTKYEFFPPDIAEAFRRYDSEVWRTKSLITQEDVVEYQGSKSHALTGKTILSIDGETEEYLLGYSIDITSRVKAEQMLRESEMRFRKLVDQAADGIFLIDQNERFVDVNVQACKMLGYSRDELLSMHVGMIYPRLPEQRQTMIKQVSSGEAANFEEWLVRKDGSLIPVDINLGLIRTNEQNIQLALVRDITDRKIAAERMERMAYHDFLTDLPNRRYIMKQSEDLFAAPHPVNRMHAIMLMDLDHFKVINDSLGHQAGDRLLQLVTLRLKACMGPSNVLARLGGDEFIVLLPDLESAEKAHAVSKSIMQVMEAPFQLDNRTVTASFSIGISIYPNDGHDIHTLLKHADIALYQSKEQGRKCCRMFGAAMLESANSRLQTETMLRYALEHNSFFVQYQPKISLENGRVLGFEALIRCRDEQGRTILPSDFISIAEETGLIALIDDWVLREACLACSNWNKIGKEIVSISVNLSAWKFQSRDLERRISAVLQETGLPPHLLELELTEGTVMNNPEEAAKTLHGLKKLGLRLSIDDFGTGFSSMSYLVNFPIDTLKIDRSFIRQTPADPVHSAISTAILTLAKSLSLMVVAEGVETQAQLEFLREHRCNAVQGYYFSRPIDREQLPDFLQSFHINNDISPVKSSSSATT